MVSSLRNNVRLKLLSVAIVLVGWGYLRLAPNPVYSARFVQQLSVPIGTTGLRSTEVARFAERQAVLAIEVPREGGVVRTDNVRAVLDLDGRPPGVYNVPVEVIAPKLTIKSLAPASVTLTIVRIEERTLPVVPHYLGASSRVVLGRISLSPATAVLRAPSDELERIAGVRVDVPLPAAARTTDAMLRPFASDVGGGELAGIAVSPNLVRVRATFVAPVRGK